MSSLNTIETKSASNVVHLTQPANARLNNPQDTTVKSAQVINTLTEKDLPVESTIVGAGALAKRLFDLVVGGTALVLLLPLLILIAIFIRLDSPGPALFYQQRRGRDKQLITVCKFRTMYTKFSTPEPTADTFIQTQKDDLRITRLGAFLRKASLDELPQLLNVIRGTMSLVGPRPHPAPLDEQFQNIIPGLDVRYAVKPGLTGWAQSNGLRGETTRVEDMSDRVKHDSYYVHNWSFWLDIKILFMTVFKGWTHRNNAY